VFVSLLFAIMVCGSDSVRVGDLTWKMIRMLPVMLWCHM
jgi:hypothetical protein